MPRTIIVCKNCGKTAELHALGFCDICYKKQYKYPERTCPKCGKITGKITKGICYNCYQKQYKYDYIKGYGIRKYHNIPFELWKEVTKSCLICGFDKCVELHHLDRNHGNNSRENFIGLCPNHHNMLHDSKYSAETEALIREKLRLRAQSDANSLQYCNNQTVERIADESTEEVYGFVCAHLGLSTCEISKELGWTRKIDMFAAVLELDRIPLNMPVE